MGPSLLFQTLTLMIDIGIILALPYLFLPPYWDKIVPAIVSLAIIIYSRIEKDGTWVGLVSISWPSFIVCVLLYNLLSPEHIQKVILFWIAWNIFMVWSIYKIVQMQKKENEENGKEEDTKV